MQRTIAAGADGRPLAGRPGSASAIRAGMSPGGRNTGSSGSNTGPPAGSSAASASSGREVDSARPPPHVRSDSWSSHRPITLRRKRTRAVDAALVREVRGPARLGQDRRVQLDARPATTCPHEM